jgi:TonB family protein
LKATRKRITILLLCILTSAASALAQDAENVLKQYEGKILVLRHPLQDKSQEYDADGKVLKGGNDGPWTVYGGVLIDHIALKPDRLRVEGRRILFLYSNQRFTAMEFKKLKGRRGTPFPPEVQLEIRLERALDSAEQARTILSRVFALNTTDIVDSVPDFWRKCLTEQFVYDPSQKQEAQFSWQAPPSKASKPLRNREIVAEPGPDAQEDHQGADSVNVLRVGSGVTAPRPTFTPEPKFSEIARYEKFQGVLVLNVIVGIDGNLHSIQVVRPLGLGLDDAARSMLETWRFKPAMREGKPVAVEMNIEVAFNLY